MGNAKREIICREAISSQKCVWVINIATKFRFSDDLKRPQRRSTKFEFFLEATAEQAQSLPSVVQTVCRGKTHLAEFFLHLEFLRSCFCPPPPDVFCNFAAFIFGNSPPLSSLFRCLSAVFRLSRVAYGNDSVGANIGTSRRRFRGKTINKNTVKTMDLFLTIPRLQNKDAKRKKKKVFAKKAVTRIFTFIASCKSTDLATITPQTLILQKSFFENQKRIRRMRETACLEFRHF